MSVSVNKKSSSQYQLFSDALINADYYYQNKANLSGNNVVSNTPKRLFDIVFSLFVLVFIFSWVYVLIGILIKLTSKGPILFIQDRIGLNKQTFKCYKFRTMKCVPVKYMYTPTTAGDTRITAIGNFLRKTNLDELPQFINVLKGQMSIVGPRPHAIAFHKTYSTFITNVNARLLVKPGITGLAQIMGYRGDVEDFEENKKRTKTRIEYDCAYIAKWTFGLDIKLIWITVQQMIKRNTNAV